MKSFFTTLLCMLLFLGTNFGQSNQPPAPATPQFEELAQQMERMMEEMRSMMGDHPMIMMDTIITKGFGGQMFPQDGFGMMPMDSLNSGNLFDLFQGQMQQMDPADWEEINKMLQQLGQQSPLIPRPDDLPEMKEGDTKKGKKKKKRKVYTL